MTNLSCFFLIFYTRKLQVGDPFDENTKMGPVVSKEHKNKIEKYIEIARQDGNEIVTGGEMDESIKKSNKGYYVMPTLILNVDDTSKLMTEEIFGPVVCVAPFDTEDEVIIENINQNIHSSSKIFMFVGYSTSK